jgi:hypothetical protein
MSLTVYLLCVVALYSYIPYTVNVRSNWGNLRVSGPSRFIDYRVVCCCCCCWLLYVQIVLHQPCINLIGNVHCNSCVYVCTVLLFQTDDVVVANSSECSRGWNDWCRPSSHSIDRDLPFDVNRWAYIFMFHYKHSRRRKRDKIIIKIKSLYSCYIPIVPTIHLLCIDSFSWIVDDTFM